MWNREPTMVAGLVQATLALAVAFGLELSGEQVGALVTFTSMVLAIVLRRNVSPVTTGVVATSSAPVPADATATAAGPAA